MELENIFSLEKYRPNLLYSIFWNSSEVCFLKTLSGKVWNVSSPDFGPIIFTYTITTEKRIWLQEVSPHMSLQRVCH